MKKKAWIKITEAFICILLIIVVLLVLINQANNPKDISEKIYNSQISILRDIQINQTLRKNVSDVDESLLPLSWSSSDFPQKIKDKINKSPIGGLSCRAKICSTNTECEITSSQDIPFGQGTKSIYSQEVTITATLTQASNDYNPRKLKLYCWEK